MFGTLELNRTDPAHIGTQQLIDLSKKLTIDGNGNASDAAPVEGKNHGTFESYLLDAMDQMNGQQVDVSKMEEQIETDPDSVDIHDVTTAMAKAQMSLSLAQTVIDRLVTGWNEISVTR
jgi:flagellar hook-basal body complex protein FliE